VVDWGGKVAAWFAAGSAASVALAGLLATTTKQPYHGWHRAAFVILVIIAVMSFAIFLFTGPPAVWGAWRDRARRSAGAAGGLHGSNPALTVAQPDARGSTAPTSQHPRRAPGVGKPDETAQLKTVAQTDPLDLDVHPALPPDSESLTEGLDALTPYLVRDHDVELRRVISQAALGGPSVFAVLAGNACTGKTRALYEAVRAITGSWPILCPLDADHLIELLQENRFRPGRVLWLNEAQRYLSGPLGEQAAALLRHTLMTCDGAVAVGALWSLPYLADLTAPGSNPDVHSAARVLLDNPRTYRIHVPDTLSDHERLKWAALAATDRRLDAALAASEPDGDVIQHLTGGPDLLRAYTRGVLFNPIEHAIITAAIDARRLGHQEPIATSLLEAAADGYLSPRQRSGEIGWCASALTSIADGTRFDGSRTSIRGAVTALTATRAHSGNAEAKYEPDDYLAQHTRWSRQEVVGPPQLWDALVRHTTNADDMDSLAYSARGRGLYRIAAQLWWKAFAIGNSAGPAHRLCDLLLAVDREGAQLAYQEVTHLVQLDDLWSVAQLLDLGFAFGNETAVKLAARTARHASIDDPFNVGELIACLDQAGANTERSILASRAANTLPLDDMAAVEIVLSVFHEVNLLDAFSVLASRTSEAAILDDPEGLSIILTELQHFAAHEALNKLAARGARDVPVNDGSKVADLITTLRHVGAEDAAAALATRAARDLPLADELVSYDHKRRAHEALSPMHSGVTDLLFALRSVTAVQPLSTLAARAARDIVIADPWNSAVLLRALADIGAQRATNILLARRPAEHAALGDLSGISELLSALHSVKAFDAVSVLAGRLANATLEDAFAVSNLLRALREAGADEALGSLAARAVAEAALDNAFGVARLLGTLRNIGAQEEVSNLLARHPEQHAHLDDLAGIGRTATADDPGGVAGLHKSLRDAGAFEQAAALSARAASDAPIDNLRDTVALIGELRYRGAAEAASRLAARAAVGAILHDSRGIIALIKALRNARQVEPLSVLIDRAANAGLWIDTLHFDSDKAQNFKFGREPDGTASPPWGWRDLAS
jgi:hypothetical protein